MKLTKAEQRALEAYPHDMVEQIEEPGFLVKTDYNRFNRAIFTRGYEQAEKDLALTWKDIAIIDNMLREVANCYATNDLSELTREDFYSEVINRFNKNKEAKK